MSIPPNPNYIDYDFSDPLCYPGSGPTVFDLSVNGYDASIVGGATFVSDGQKSYFQFNGGSDAIATGTNSTAGLSDFTLNVWCYPENSSGENIVLSIGNDGSGTIPFIDYSLFTSGKFLISNGFGAGTVEASILTPINNWYMVTYTKIGSDLKIYIDGVLAGSTTGTIAISASTEFRLAAYATGVAPHFVGRIGIASIYGSGLTGSQVTDVYTSTVGRFYPLQAPICSFDFSNPACFNGTGTAVNDLSTSNNDFTLDNTNYTFTTTYGGEILIDQNNRFGRFTDLNDFSYGVNAYSVIMWMQQNSQGASDFNMFHILQETGGVGSNNTIYFGTKPGTAGNQLFVSDGTATSDTTYDFPLNTWKMVAFTKDTGAPYDNTHIYIDGVEITQTWTGSATINVGTGDPMFFANPSPAGGFWNFDVTIGQTDIYAEFLSSADILDYFNNTSARYSPPPPPTPSNVGGRQFAQGFNG
jgi:hypothetical protein